MPIDMFEKKQNNTLAELMVHQKCRSHDNNLFSESEKKNKKPVNPICSTRAHIPINT